MKLFNKTVVVMALLVFGISACKFPTPTTSQQEKTDRKKNRAVNHLMAKQDVTELDFSMDRYLLDQRNTRFNNPGKMNYLYINFFDGTWLRFTIRGKLTSTSKRLTSPVKNYRVDRGQYTGTTLGPAADMMGTHGSSGGSAKIGITTLGSLLEFGGMVGYVYSEVPLIFTNMDKAPVEVELELTEEEKKELKISLKALLKQSKRSRR